MYYIYTYKVIVLIVLRCGWHNIAWKHSNADSDTD